MNRVRLTLQSFGPVDIDADSTRVLLTQPDDGGDQNIMIAWDQLSSLIKLLQRVEREAPAHE